MNKWMILLPAMMTGLPGSAQALTIKSGDVSGQSWPAGTYWITGDISVSPATTLTLAPGVVAKFDPGIELLVYGTLAALGTTVNPVAFTSRDDNSLGETVTVSDGDPNAGDWDGIYCYGYSSTDGVGSFDHVVLAYGGGASGSAQANLSFFHSDSGSLQHSISAHSLAQGVAVHNCSPEFQDVQFQTSGGHGLHVTGSSAPLVTDCVFSGNAGYAAWIDTPYHTSYSGNSGSGNGVNGLGLMGSLSTAATWSMGAADFPFVLAGDLVVSDNVLLTLPPGTVIKALPGAQITCYGSLSALGTVVDPIVFTSIRDDSRGGDTNADGAASAPAAGDWDGIYCYGYSSTDGVGSFDHVVLAYSGGATGSAQANLSFYYSDSGSLQHSISAHSLAQGVAVHNCSPEFQDVQFQTSGGHGLHVNGSSAAQVTDCVFSGNAGYAAWIDTPYHTSYSGNSGSGNGVNGLGLMGTLGSSNTWSMGAADFSFVLVGDLNISDNQTLTLPPGTVVKAVAGAEITCYGTLSALGSSGSPIVFTSIRDDSRGGDTNADGAASAPAAGDWDGIYCYGYSSTDGVGSFDHVVLAYGGGASGSAQANLSFFHPDSATLTDINCRHSATTGIALDGCFAPLSRSLVTDNLGAGVVIWSGQPVLGALDGSAGGGNGIYDNNGGTWQVVNYSPFAIEAAHTYWVHESPVTIDQHIYDDDENASCGEVLFTPWQSATGAPVLVEIDAADPELYLRWMPAWGATAYRVYSSDQAFTGYVLDESGVYTGTTWTAPRPVQRRYYQATALRD